MVYRLRHTLTHQSGRRYRVIQPREDRHLEDRRDAAPLIAQRNAGGGVEFHLAGSIRAISEFVLESLQTQSVQGAIGKKSRDEEARRTTWGLGEHQKRIAHWCGEEPLVAR